MDRGTAVSGRMGVSVTGRISSRFFTTVSASIVFLHNEARRSYCWFILQARGAEQPGTVLRPVTATKRLGQSTPSLKQYLVFTGTAPFDVADNSYGIGHVRTADKYFGYGQSAYGKLTGCINL